MITYFENLTVELYVLCAFNTQSQILCQLDIIYYIICGGQKVKQVNLQSKLATFAHKINF